VNYKTFLVMKVILALVIVGGMALSFFLWEPYSRYTTIAKQSSERIPALIDDPAAYEQLVVGKELTQRDRISMVDYSHARNDLPTGMKGLIELLSFQMKPYSWFDAEANTRQLEVLRFRDALRVDPDDGRILLRRDSNGEVDRFRIRRWVPESTVEYWMDEGNLQIQGWTAVGK